jgi:hypothetical protein
MTSSGTPRAPEPPKSPVKARRLILWRWRRNPLRRRSDLVEAWLGVISVLAIAAGGTVAGALAFLGVTRDLAEQRDERRSVPAVVVEDVGDGRAGVKDGGTGFPESATVRWRAPDGAAREGRTVVDPGAGAGTGTTVWIGRDGQLVGEPITRDEAGVHGAVAALAVGSGVCLAVMSARRAATAVLNRRRARAWEYEWAEFGPHWQRGPNGPGK